MKKVKFKEKGKSGQVLGLGHIDNDWKEVSDTAFKHFEQVNTTLGPPNAKGEREVLRKRTAANYGLEVQSVADPKPESNEKKEGDN
jgi:hypothetical protein